MNSRRAPRVTIHRTRLDARKRITETTYTRDLKVPLVIGDEDFEFGWQSIPLAPDPDPNWEIFDRSHDRRTGWKRIRFIEDA